MSTRNRILEGADALFMKFGIRTITMDDIARHLGMSKKTVYQHFADKKEIVMGVAKAHLDSECTTCTMMHTQANDPVHEVVLLLNWISSMYQKHHPAMIYDVQKYYPEAWELFHDFKYNFVLGTVIENLEKGIRLGLYRPDIHVNILARLRMEEVELGMNPAAFPPDQFDMREVQMEMLRHFLHGVVTPEGRKLLDKYNSVSPPDTNG